MTKKRMLKIRCSNSVILLYDNSVHFFKQKGGSGQPRYIDNLVHVFSDAIKGVILTCLYLHTKKNQNKRKLSAIDKCQLYCI